MKCWCKESRQWNEDWKCCPDCGDYKCFCFREEHRFTEKGKFCYICGTPRPKEKEKLWEKFQTIWTKDIEGKKSHSMRVFATTALDVVEGIVGSVDLYDNAGTITAGEYQSKLLQKLRELR